MLVWGTLFEPGHMRLIHPAIASRISVWVGVVAAVLWWPALIVLYISTG